MSVLPAFNRMGPSQNCRIFGLRLSTHSNVVVDPILMALLCTIAYHVPVENQNRYLQSLSLLSFGPLVTFLTGPQLPEPVYSLLIPIENWTGADGGTPNA